VTPVSPVVTGGSGMTGTPWPTTPTSLDDSDELQPFGAMIVDRRQRLGLSQYTLAARLAEVSGDTSIDRGHVRRWEHHDRLPRPYWRRHLSAALHIPRETIDRAVALAYEERARARAREKSAGVVPPRERLGHAGTEPVAGEAVRWTSTSPTLVATFDLWDGLMRRRDLLLGAGAAALFGGLADAAAADVRAHSAGDVAPPFDREALAAHTELHAALGRVENMHGPLAVFTSASAHHHELLAWYRRLTSRSERRRLAGLLPVTAGFMGWLAFDLDRHRDAAVWFRQAAQIAADIGDLGLCAYNTAQASRALAHAGQPVDALALSEAAVAVAGGSATVPVRSWLHAVRAHHRALVGEERACLADLEVAGRLLDSMRDDKPVYISYLNRADIAKWTGHSLVALGETTGRSGLLRDGRAAIADADTHWPSAMVRGRAEVLVTRASASLAAGDVDEAAARLGDAHMIASVTGSIRNQRNVQHLRRALEPHRDAAAVRALDQRIHARAG
jgi:hypothetical protein